MFYDRAALHTIIFVLKDKLNRSGADFDAKKEKINQLKKTVERLKDEIERIEDEVKQYTIRKQKVYAIQRFFFLINRIVNAYN